MDIYQANPLAKCRRKRIEYVDRWFDPSPQSLIAALRFLELMDLILKYGQNSCGRVRCLELVSEWVRDKILLGLCFISLEGFFKNDIEIGRGRYGGGNLGARLTHIEEMVVTLQTDRVKERW